MLCEDIMMDEVLMAEHHKSRIVVVRDGGRVAGVIKSLRYRTKCGRAPCRADDEGRSGTRIGSHHATFAPLHAHHLTRTTSLGLETAHLRSVAGA